jgi:hypothetical protein
VNNLIKIFQMQINAKKIAEKKVGITTSEEREKHT